MNIRKSMCLLIAFLMTICLTPGAFFSVQAADNDNVNVTCYGSYLECNIVNLSWDIGVIQMSTSYWTNKTSETLVVDTHNCTPSVNTDFEMVVSSDAATFFTVWRGNASTGADQYRLNATSDAFVTEEQLNLTVYQDVDNNFDPANNVSLDMCFESPTSTTTGVQQTITLNGKVTVH